MLLLLESWLLLRPTTWLSVLSVLTATNHMIVIDDIMILCDHTFLSQQ